MSRRQAQSGFTLIEVSLAIVIGVIVLAGAITLYNQTKVSTGNSKAQEKVLALASLVEEMSANNNGAYPTSVNLENAFVARNSDALSSPWSGALGAGGAIINGAVTYTWGSGTIPTAVIGTETASAGQCFYILGNAATSSIYDGGQLLVRTYTGYIVGIANNKGEFLSFTVGGK